MAPVRRKQTARKVIGTGTATKTSSKKESLKLRRAERAEARRVKAEGDKDSSVCNNLLRVASYCLTVGTCPCS